MRSSRYSTASVLLTRGETTSLQWSSSSPGTYLANAVGPFGEVVGIETSPVAAINARKRIEANRWKNVRVVVGDAKTIEPTGMFDGLVMFAASDMYASPTQLPIS